MGVHWVIGMCRPMTKRQEHFVFSKFIRALTHSFIHFQYLLCAVHPAMLDKIEGFRMVQTEYTISSQSPDLNFANIPGPPGFSLYKLPSEGEGAFSPATQISGRVAWVVAKA